MELQRAFRDRRHARWAQAARDGDERALVRLYDELHPPVASYLRLRVRSSHDAEDLVSTVFHRFLSNLERFDPRKGSVLGWVLVMARHALIDHLRRTRPTVPVDDVAEVLAGDLPDPLEGLIRTEQADRVRAVVAQLPAEARELLALHYGQGLRLRDIGGLLGLGEAAVKQRLSRLRRELRERLRHEHDPAGRPAAARAQARPPARAARTG